MTLCATGVAIGRQAPAPRPSASPADTAATSEEIRAIVARRVDVEKQSVGIVVGMEDRARRQVLVCVGRGRKDDPLPPTQDTVFEIGSITKAFTAILLADMVQRGEVALTDPVDKYLPAGTKVPARGGRHITLQDLAMHTSGLPRMPTNFSPGNPANPYADYGFERLKEFLANYTLTRDIGAQYEYSNVGAGLLGTILARRAGMDYGALVQSRITGPLGMKSTRLDLSADMAARLANGHNRALEQVPSWDFPARTSTFAGAGGLRSTASDMLAFVAANAGTRTTPLSAAMAATVATRRPTGRPGVEVALGWHITTTPSGKEIVWHNGGTGGYRTFAGYDRKAGVGVVALSNTSTPTGVDDIGMHLLDRALPLAQFSTPDD
jgi:CubicO group peptidase (beta-lactamase class C family)